MESRRILRDICRWEGRAATIQGITVTQGLRIGYIVPQFPGQTHIFFWREILALERMGHAVRVLSTRKPPAGLIAHDWSTQAMARTAYLGKVDPLHMLTGAARLPQALWPRLLGAGPAVMKDVALSLAAADRLRAQAVRHRLDHVHAHSCGRAALIAMLAYHMGGPGYSLTLHGPLSDYGSGQRLKWRDARFATIITQRLLEEVHQTLPAEDLPERLIVRPMGVDTAVLERTTPYFAPEHGRPLRIFSCGRLNMVKGHQDLMTAARQLLDQGVDIRIEIAGEDDQGGAGFRKDLEEHLKKLRLQDHVKLLGAIDSGAVRAKLEEAHLFVLASWHEPLGVAYMEAMSMGVPTIGTDAGGVRELISDGSTGYLVEPKNPGQLARTIRTLAGDPDALMRLSVAGRAHVEAHFRASLGAEVLADEIARLRDRGESPSG